MSSPESHDDEWGKVFDPDSRFIRDVFGFAETTEITYPFDEASLRRLREWDAEING